MLPNAPQSAAQYRMKGELAHNLQTLPFLATPLSPSIQRCIILQLMKDALPVSTLAYYPFLLPSQARQS